jgi:hypothetical protein
VWRNVRRACECRIAEWLATPIQEQGRIDRALACQPTQVLDGRLPEWATPLFNPLADNLNGLGVPIDITDPDGSGFAHTSTGVIEEEEQGIIAPSLVWCLIGGSK